MSLILDALRRADRERERERGGVPSLYTQAPPPWTPPDDEPRAGGRPRPWLWLAAGLGGGLVLAAVWALWSATPVAPTGAGSVEPPPVPSARVAQAPAAEPAAPPPREAGPVAQTEPPRAAAPAPAPPAATTAPAPPAAAIERPAPEAPPARAATPAAAVPPPAAPAPAATAGRDPPPRDEPKSEAAAPAPERPAAAPIRQIGELPADVRSQLPALTIGGAMYSSKAASRRLIVNGQLLSEGDQVAPGLVLEEIRLKSAVLRWRDLRYEQGF